MVAHHPDSVDAKNKFEDLSGVNVTAFENPYDALIEACQDDPGQIQKRYETHRKTRNAQQREKLLSPAFSGLIIDSILQRLHDPTIEPGFKDSRNCIVFWARPPAHIKALVNKLQQELLTIAPNLWLMPLERLHLTAFEVTHSLTFPEVHSILSAMGPSTIETMTDYTYTHRARLIKPMISYDGAAVALSFLPAAGESLAPSEDGGRTKSHDTYTYHHLRRDLFALAKSTGISIDSRYVVPSSHITVGRFLTQADHDSPGKMGKWIEKIERLNQWLEEEWWSKEEKGRDEERAWIVGTEKGLDCRQGTLWYGGGETVRLGKGF